MLPAPRTAAAAWRVFRALGCLFFLPLSYSVYKLLWCFSSFFLCFSSSLFSSCRPHRRRCGARQFVSSISHFFYSSLSMCLLSFVLFFPLSFLYFIECACRARRIQYDDMALHCPLMLLAAYLARGNVVSLWRSFVTT